MQEHKALIDPATVEEAIAKSGFGVQALSFLRYERFQPSEVDYKLSLADDLRKAQWALINENGNWCSLLKKAINSPDDNLIYWRLSQPFLAWCETNSDSAKKGLATLWDSSIELGKRIDTFVECLVGAGITQPGAQLCVTSVLLMASAPVDCPPVRTNVLSRMLEKLDLPKIPSGASVAERYTLFAAILDSLIAFSQNHSRPLKNRLEAQGAVWCATGGWKTIPLEVGDGITIIDSGEDIEREIHDAAQELEGLGETERKAVISARRGQGRYRNDLLNVWIGCAVTRCTVARLLRASHLKPWKLSNNAERLNPFNGLLLTPNLDLALDRWLISFTDEGFILISNKLKDDDAKALGIHSGMKLHCVMPGHKPFLTFHRTEFLKRENTVEGSK